MLSFKNKKEACVSLCNGLVQKSLAQFRLVIYSCNLEIAVYILWYKQYFYRADPGLEGSGNI